MIIVHKGEEILPCRIYISHLGVL